MPYQASCSDPHAAQINLLRHQHTELPAGKYKKKKSAAKSRQSSYKQQGSESSQVQSQHKKRFDVKSVPIKIKIDVPSVVTQFM